MDKSASESVSEESGDLKAAGEFGFQIWLIETLLTCAV